MTRLIQILRSEVGDQIPPGALAAVSESAEDVGDVIGSLWPRLSTGLRDSVSKVFLGVIDAAGGELATSYSEKRAPRLGTEVVQELIASLHFVERVPGPAFYDTIVRFKRGLSLHEHRRRDDLINLSWRALAILQDKTYPKGDLWGALAFGKAVVGRMPQGGAVSIWRVDLESRAVLFGTLTKIATEGAGRQDPIDARLLECPPKRLPSDDPVAALLTRMMIRKALSWEELERSHGCSLARRDGLKFLLPILLRTENSSTEEWGLLNLYFTGETFAEISQEFGSSRYEAILPLSQSIFSRKIALVDALRELEVVWSSSVGRTTGHKPSSRREHDDSLIMATALQHVSKLEYKAAGNI